MTVPTPITLASQVWFSNWHSLRAGFWPGIQAVVLRYFCSTVTLTILPVKVLGRPGL
jgi:hypothetical protein